MEYRTLELNVVSAKDIKDVNLLSKMDVYAVVSISGDSQNVKKMKTPVHRDGGTNPTWNFQVKFTVDESLAHQNRLSLEIKLFSERTFAGNTLIGTVYVPVKELIENPGDGSFRHVSYQVRTQSGKAKGLLNLSYKFGDKVAAPMKSVPGAAYPPPAAAYPPPATAYPPPAARSKQEPVMAYPAGGAWGSSTAPPPHGAVPYAAPPQQHGYGYPPPQQSGYGYPPIQQPGYGYPQQPGYGYGYPQPQQSGYGYPPVQQQGKKKNKFGMGLGAGLLGGALGGLLIGDMVSDVADYDAGFDDAGGFDF
ncbi:PREDICTED: protein SRC2-like isoform X2 [Lupinus angustifolius]|uniref:protein SRC2-like isoform X2 n=1 Tax=Lupinus angustifolius TaxID=3871 RepID=UPI00092EA874|nr:PREDICTED: protein SRC2-like isoform X2 [Lupinus angustifolius]